VDVRKAYDTVWHDGLFAALLNHKVNGRTLRVLMDWYTNGTSQIRINHKLSHSFPLRMGIRQGNVNSTLEFSVFIDELCKTLASRGYGVEVFGTWIGDVFFADDFVLLARDALELQLMLDVVDLHSKRWHFRINSEKTKVMIFRGTGTDLSPSDPASPPVNEDCDHMNVTPTTVGWTMYGEPLEVVESFKYLGIYINPTISWVPQTNKKRAVMKFSVQRCVRKGMCDRGLPIANTTTVYKTLVVSSVLFGAEVWFPKPKHANSPL